MQEILNANIFFFISSLTTVVVGAGFIVLLYYLIPLVRDARDMMAKFRTAAQEIEKDFEMLRTAAEEEGAKTKALLDVVLGFVGHLFYTPPRRRAKKISKK